VSRGITGAPPAPSAALASAAGEAAGSEEHAALMRNTDPMRTLRGRERRSARDGVCIGFGPGHSTFERSARSGFASERDIWLRTEESGGQTIKIE
jgi:hypothetical protein